MKVHTKPTGPVVIPPRDPALKWPAALTCGTCGAIFTTTNALVSHGKWAHA
jgi:hypothetical protein